MADGNDNPGKLFVGGLAWETTEEKLKEYFEAYGEVVEAPIMKDKVTQRPRGFGFVVFKDAAVAESVAAEKHTIDGRQVEAKVAVPRGTNSAPSRQQGGPSRGFGDANTKTKKIFVGGLAPTTDEANFREYFEQFGSIEDVVVMYDQTTQRPRGFGFVTFESEEAVDRVFTIGDMHELQEKKVEIKRAVPKDSMPAGSPRGGGRGGGRGMGGGGRGMGGGGRGMGGGQGGYDQGGYGQGFAGGYGGGYGGQYGGGGYGGGGYGDAGMGGYGGGMGYGGAMPYGGGMGYGTGAPYGGQRQDPGNNGMGYGGQAAGYGGQGSEMSPYGAYGGMVAAQYGGAPPVQAVGAAYSAAAGAGYTNDTYGAAVAAGYGADAYSSRNYGASARDASSGRSERTFRPY